MEAKTPLQFEFKKKRAEFGKPYSFTQHENLDVDIKPDKNLAQNFVRINPVSQGTQESKGYSCHEVCKFLIFLFIKSIVYLLTSVYVFLHPEYHSLTIKRLFLTYLGNIKKNNS